MDYTDQLQTTPAYAGDGCRLTIIVPVYGESPRRAAALIDSIRAQRNVPLGSVEIIYVVNNGPDASDQVQHLNQTMLAQPFFSNRGSSPDIWPRVMGIDASSIGLAIPECNAGRARQAALQLSAGRYVQRGINGIILSTDADVTLADRDLLAKVLRQFDNDPQLIGLAGGREFVFDLDDNTAEEIAELHSKLPQFRLWSRWRNLSIAIQEGGSEQHNKFHGQATICRSQEAIASGGFLPVNFGEDVLFGNSLSEYAGRYGRHVRVVKQDLRVRVAFRISDRTDNSYRQVINSINPEQPMMVNDPLRPGTLVPLTPSNDKRWRAAVELLPGGRDYVQFLVSGSSVATVRIAA